MNDVGTLSIQFWRFTLSGVCLAFLFVAAPNQTTAQENEESEPANPLADVTAEEAVQSVQNAMDRLKKLDEDGGISKNTQRIWRNFTTLMANSWQDVAFSAADLVGKLVFWCVVFGLTGFFSAIILYLLLHFLGWTQFDWQYYWTVAWLWPVAFLISMSIGFAYAGAFHGIGTYCKKAIIEDRVIERVTMTMYCTLVMENAEYEATGEESIGDLLDVLDSADEYQVEFDDRFRKELQSHLKTDDSGWLQQEFASIATDAVDGRIGKWAEDNGVDVRVLIVAYLDREEAERRFGSVTVKEVLASSAPLFERGRDLAYTWVATAITPNVYVGIIVGVGIPLGLLFSIHGIVYLVRLSRRTWADEPADPANFQTELPGKQLPPGKDSE